MDDRVPRDGSEEEGDGDDSVIEVNTTRDEELSEDPRAHLQDLDDGIGCVELWEQLSERRR